MSCVSPQSSSHLPIQKHFHQTPTRLAAGGWRAGARGSSWWTDFQTFYGLVKMWSSAPVCPAARCPPVFWSIVLIHYYIMLYQYALNVCKILQNVWCKYFGDPNYANWGFGLPLKQFHPSHLVSVYAASNQLMHKDAKSDQQLEQILFINSSCLCLTVPSPAWSCVWL